MTREEQKNFAKDLGACHEQMDGHLGNEPRYQLTGEVIPESFRRNPKDMCTREFVQ